MNYEEIPHKQAEENEACPESLEKSKDYERDRKARWRAEQKAKKDGTYKPSPLEKAKDILEVMEAPDVDQVMNSDDFRENLKPEDRKLL
jgi:hypothetical protein